MIYKTDAYNNRSKKVNTDQSKLNNPDSTQPTQVYAYKTVSSLYQNAAGAN